jgi:hypothetical protein
MYDKDIERKIIEIGYKAGKIRINLKAVSPVPEQDLWFEKVWKDYLEDNYLDC